MAILILFFLLSKKSFILRRYQIRKRLVRYLSKILCLSLRLPFFKNIRETAGTKTNDTNKDENKIMAIVIGKIFKYSPKIPLTNNIGTKADTVVNTPAVKGFL